MIADNRRNSSNKALLILIIRPQILRVVIVIQVLKPRVNSSTKQTPVADESHAKPENASPASPDWDFFIRLRAQSENPDNIK